MTKTETKSLIVESFNTDFERRLNFETLGRDLLNTAELHADKRRFGVNDIRPNNHAWVLSRLAIEMYEMPIMFTQLDITTWIESIYRLFTNRNFEIKESSGKVLGYARSIWAMIDRTTRQPIELEKIYGEQFKQLADPDKECPILPQTHLRPLQNAVCEREYTVVSSDIDYNIHVNSIKYIQHMYDLFSIDYYRTHTIKRLEIAYINETHFGDTLCFFKQEISEGKYEIEIRKQNGDIAVRGLICF